MENAERMCDSVCIIARGEKILDGTVTAVKTTHGTQSIAVSLRDSGPEFAAVFADRQLVAKCDDQNRFFEVELAGGANPQELLRRLMASGATIERFELVQPSLHQIFIQRVGADGVEKGMSGHG
jgi:ABC-2 type transport system ATP-binding protein